MFLKLKQDFWIFAGRASPIKKMNNVSSFAMVYIFPGDLHRSKFIRKTLSEVLSNESYDICRMLQCQVQRQSQT